MKNAKSFIFKNLTDSQIDDIPASVLSNILQAMEEYANLHTQALREENERLKESIQRISEYWDKEETQKSMRTALYYINKESKQALKGK